MIDGMAPPPLPPTPGPDVRVPDAELIAKITNEFLLEDARSPRPGTPPDPATTAPPARQFAPMEEGSEALNRYVNSGLQDSHLPGRTLGHFYFLAQQAGATAGPSPFDVTALRSDFPILQSRVHGKPLIWLDNAATTQKPYSVIQALSQFFERDNSNVHRGAHELARRSTEAYEGAREKVQHFLGAVSPSEIIFVRGATEAINLVAQTYGDKYVGPGDEVLLTTVEHHSNIVPWQFLCKRKGAILRVAPINNSGEVILEEYEKLLGPRTKVVALTHVSNALGTVLPVQTMTAMAHRHGARVLLDGAQAAAHFKVNVQALDCDFYAFSGHKIFAPTGIGVLYGKRALLADMPPWQGGGSMINKVTFDETTFAQLPYKFEAGTGNIAGAVGLGAAIDYVNQIGLEAVAAHEQMLTEYASEGLRTVPGLRQIGTSRNKVSVLSFVLEGLATEAVGKALDQEGIAVRAGHHCAQPALRHFNLTSTVRPSLALYNTREEIDALLAAIHKIKRASA